MSDISLHFTWWEIVLWTLAILIWPLTGFALAAGIWVWRQPASRLARSVAIVAGILWIGSAGTRLLSHLTDLKNQRDYEADLRARQTTLTRSEVIAGMHLPAGTVVTHGQGFYASEVTDLDLPAATEIHGILLRGHVHLADGALDNAATLAKDAPIDGVPCSATAPVRFGSGKLLECDLVAATRVKGIPCVGHVNLEQGLRCELAGDYSRFGYVWRAKTNVTDFGDLVWFRIGALAPSLHAFGVPLRTDSEVQYAHGRLASIDLQASPGRYRGCDIDLIVVQNGAMQGRSTGQCSLPQAPGSLYIALPAATVGPR